MALPAVFAIIVGLGMIGQWMASFIGKQVPELKTEPIRLWFHIAAEMTTALCLIISGIGLLLTQTWSTPLYLVASGMLFYTAIVSPGYFAQKGSWIWPAIFAVLITLGVVNVLTVLRT